MANTETIIWTTVPNGVVVTPPGATAPPPPLRLSVLVSPNLAGAAGLNLSMFPDFVNWPQLVAQQGLSFTVHIFNGATQIGTSTATIDTSVLRPDIWAALFGPPANIEVTPRDPGEPYTDQPVISYPAGQIAGWLQEHYTDWAVNNPSDFPSLQSLDGDLEGIANVGPRLTASANVGPPLFLAQLKAERDGVVKATGRPKRANDFTGATDAAAFAALGYYHAPRGGGGVHSPFAAPELPQIDFHRALTFIGAHPALQRALGLVFDIDASFPATGALPSNGFVSVTPSFSPSRLAVAPTYIPVTPRTSCTMTATVFEARPATTQINGRQLTLGDTNSFLVHRVDVDGGGLKTIQLANNVSMAQLPPPNFGPPAPDAPQGFAPPALRSAGLTVTAVNRGLTFVSRLDRSEALIMGMPSSVPDLTAEDLVRGFVLDVHDASGNTWHSTAMRNASYTAGATPTLTASDEASTDAPPRMASDASDPKQLNLPENLIRWDGWSLAAPRPGVPIQDDGSVQAGGVDPGPFSQMKMSFTPPPGTLPRLRFGETYQVRMRVVDVAGNVIPLAAGADVGDKLRVSPPILYGRHEPIGSPDILHSAPSVPGESLKRLVIRGNYNAESTETSPRTFASKPTAQLFAEHHGTFDPTPHGAPLTSAYAVIVAPEGGVPRVDARYLKDPTTQIAEPITLTAPVPYLPDPLARGGVLSITDGALAGQTVPFDFSPASGDTWPDYRPFGLVLVPGPAPATSVSPTARTVTFALSKADVVTVRLSSTFANGDLPMLGVYEWVSEHFGGGVPALYRSQVVAGAYWAFTPFTELELVYAVQQPLLEPGFLAISPSRELGWTYAELRGEYVFSRKSTSKIDLLATWNDPVDGGTGAPEPSGPGVPVNTTGVNTDTPVFTTTIDQTTGNPLEELFDGRHEFHDTKHRNVTYRANATSSFTEHFAGHTQLVGPPLDVPQPLSAIGLEPGSVKVTSQDGKTAYVENTNFTIDPVGGTITFTTSPPAGSTVEIDFLPPVSRPTPTVDFQERNILSSARPASLEIRDIVPIFAWVPVTKKGNKVLSGRTPSALRVFLERPWWSSGVDELLGVVTWPLAEPRKPSSVGIAVAKNIPDETAHYVSDWGADPVFGGPALPSLHPRLATFPKSPAADHGTNLTIAESTGILVNVAGHPVGYDPERQLWYCDVVVETGKAYTPMIRLALARYQQNSIPGVELGRIILADIMSLDPGRIVIITRKSKTVIATITLTGYSYTKAGDRAHTGPGEAFVTVQRRNPHVKDPVLGWEDVGKPVPMFADTAKNGLTTWTARVIKLPPHEKLRLVIEQYEEVPTDNRSQAIYIAPPRSVGLRLLYQDLIPL